MDGRSERGRSDPQPTKDDHPATSILQNSQQKRSFKTDTIYFELLELSTILYFEFHQVLKLLVMLRFQVELSY